MGDYKGARENNSKKHDDTEHGHEPEFLGQYREDEIRVRRRQIKKFLHARSHAYSEQLSASKSDARLNQFKSGGERIGPRIEEARYTPHAVRRDDRENRHPAQSHSEYKHERPEPDTSEKQHGEHRHRHHHQGAHVGFQQEQRADHSHHQAHHDDSLGEILERLLLAHEITSEIHHHEKFHELRRLY